MTPKPPQQSGMTYETVNQNETDPFTRQILDGQAQMPPRKLATWSPKAVSKVAPCESAQCPNSASHGLYCYPHYLSHKPVRLNWEADAETL